MNSNAESHVDESTLERYALARLPPEDFDAVEEHLLICAKCRDLLAKVEEYIQVAKVALEQGAGFAVKAWKAKRLVVNGGWIVGGKDVLR